MSNPDPLRRFSPLALVIALEQGEALPPPTQVDPDSPDWAHALMALVKRESDPDRAGAWLDQVVSYASAIGITGAIGELVTHTVIPLQGLRALLAHVHASEPASRASLLEAVQLLIRTTEPSEHREVHPGRLVALGDLLRPLVPLTEEELSPVRLALGWAVDYGVFDPMYREVRRWIPSVINDRVLLTKVLNAPDPRPFAEVLADVTPEMGGLLLFRAIYWGKSAQVSVAQLKDETYRWPFPVATALDLRLKGKVTLQERTATREQFARAVEGRLRDPDLSADLKQRLMDACRPLRPLIAEGQFRAQDRQQDLENWPARPGRPRHRT